SWNIYNGGIDVANRQEQIRRTDEQRMRLHRITREVEEAVKLSWDRRDEQRRRLTELRRQHDSILRLISSYTEQFKIGQRSLLDLLDTQNTRVASQIAVETASAAVQFAEFRILASTGTLLSTRGVQKPSASTAYARELHKVPPTPPAETQRRHSPARDGSLGPIY
ncbi:MAG: TolC family protein, partial [Aestuariivirgaceae bacterium]